MGNACGCVWVDGDRDPRELATPPLMGEDAEQTTVNVDATHTMESDAPSTAALDPQTSTRDAALMRARQARIARLSKARTVLSERPIRGMELSDLSPDTSNGIALRV